jgi:hypothetical protein
MVLLLHPHRAFSTTDQSEFQSTTDLNSDQSTDHLISAQSVTDLSVMALSHLRHTPITFHNNHMLLHLKSLKNSTAHR